MKPTICTHECKAQISLPLQRPVGQRHQPAAEQVRCHKGTAHGVDDDENDEARAHGPHDAHKREHVEDILQ